MADLVCPLCSAGRETVHEEAHRLLHEALRVVAMPKAMRDDYYVRLNAQRGKQAVVELVAVVNTVRRTTKRREE